MILLVQVIGALYGLLAVLFGAFGAHALKKSFTEEQLKSFETGIKYQMYHGILLLVLGFNLGFTTALETYIGYSFIWGSFFFHSVSMPYALVQPGVRNLNGWVRLPL